MCLDEMILCGMGNREMTTKLHKEQVNRVASKKKEQILCLQLILTSLSSLSNPDELM